jgi:flagellar biosynthesis/type III secretory pathway protein FliH
MADSILEVSIGANRHIVDELMGDDIMFETLMEIMEPKITEIRKRDKEEYLQEGIQKGMREGIRGAVEMLRNLQYQDTEIKSEIIKQYGLTEDEADRYLRV